MLVKGATGVFLQLFIIRYFSNGLPADGLLTYIIMDGFCLFRHIGESIGHTVAQCFDLYSMLLAVGRTHIDYLSLDVEGPELLVLKTIPFDRITIDIITVEYKIKNGNINKVKSLDKLHNLRTFFHDTGRYEEVGIIPAVQDCCGLDVVFKRIWNRNIWQNQWLSAGLQ